MEKKKILNKVLKILLIMIVLLFIIFIIHTIRNYIIIIKMRNRISEYIDKDVYVKTISNYKNDNSTVTMEYYRKKDKNVRFIYTDISKMSVYYDSEKYNTFLETGNAKIAKRDVNANNTDLIMINGLETEKKWYAFIGAICSKIRSVKCNNKDCYEITGFKTSSSLTYDTQKIYIEKDTGLLIKLETQLMIYEREQNFNEIDDSIFIEPDINQYTLVKD